MALYLPLNFQGQIVKLLKITNPKQVSRNTLDQLCVEVWIPLPRLISSYHHSKSIDQYINIFGVLHNLIVR